MIIRFSLFLTFFLLLVRDSISQQLLDNPSLEGPAGMTFVPPSWEACGAGSTPDTQPGNWGVMNAGSNGNAYLCMVCRGIGGPLTPACEAVQQQLKQNLAKQRCYSLSLDLSYSTTMINGYNNPVKLQVYGATFSCGNEELLWESPKIDFTQWKSFQIKIIPNDEVNYLIFKADYASTIRYYGNITIDNLNLTELASPTTVRIDTTLAPGETILLKASKGTNYKWKPSSNISCSNCESAMAIVKDSITYTATFTSVEGCFVSEKFILKIKGKHSTPDRPTPDRPEKPEEEIFHIPNVFTPENNGVNDFFYIKGLTANSKLSIFNRWGKLIYSTNNYKNDWNGEGHAAGTWGGTCGGNILLYLFLFQKHEKL